MRYSASTRFTLNAQATPTAPDPDEPLVPEPVPGRENEPLKPLDPDLPYASDNPAGRVHRLILVVCLAIAGAGSILAVDPGPGPNPMMAFRWAGNHHAMNPVR